MPINSLKLWIKPPSLSNDFWQDRRLKQFLQQLYKGRVLNVGTHEKNLGGSVIYADIICSPTVDIVLDIHHLPFKTGSLDGIVITALLEHVLDPHQAIDECYRVLRDGGKVYASVPFLFPYHADPCDFQRFTSEGIRKLFKQFDIILTEKTRGVGSMLGVILREFFSIILSFNNRKVYRTLRYFFSWLLFPLKYLDHLTVNNKFENIIAPSFTVIAEKRLSNSIQNERARIAK